MASTLLDVCGNDRTVRDDYMRRILIAFLAGYASYKHTTTAHTPFLSSASLSNAAPPLPLLQLLLVGVMPLLLMLVSLLRPVDARCDCFLLLPPLTGWSLSPIAVFAGKRSL